MPQESGFILGGHSAYFVSCSGQIRSDTVLVPQAEGPDLSPRHPEAPEQFGQLSLELGEGAFPHGPSIIN